MSSDYLINAQILSDRGVPISEVPSDALLKIDGALVLNGVSAVTVELGDVFDFNLIAPDRRIRFEITDSQNATYILGEKDFLIRRTSRRTEGYGYVYTISGLCPVSKCDEYRVLYKSGTNQAKKELPADDFIKQIVLENLGVLATPPFRNLVGLRVEDGASLAPVVSKEFSWRNALELMIEISKDSEKKGTPLYFDIVLDLQANPISEPSLVFKTYTGLRGVDRSLGAEKLTMSIENGALLEIEVVDDRQEEATYILAAGQGEANKRLTKDAQDINRSESSIWGHRERFIDARNVEDDSNIQSEADSELELSRPKVEVFSKLGNSSEYQFLKDWNLGDRVEIEEGGRVYKPTIDMVAFQYTLEKGFEALATARASDFVSV